MRRPRAGRSPALAVSVAAASAAGHKPTRASRLSGGRRWLLVPLGMLVASLLPPGSLALAQPARLPPSAEEAAPDGNSPPPAEEKPAQEKPAEKIVQISIRGNRKTEDEVIRGVIQSRPGDELSADRVRQDLRAIWRLGYFDDLRALSESREGGVALVFVLREKPAIRKVLVAGNDEIGLDKINEVLDLKRDAILNVGQVKRNLEKIRDLYGEKGFYLAEVKYELRTISATEVDIFFRINERAKVEIRRISFLGNKALSDQQLKSVMRTSESGILSFLTSAGTYREDAFREDLILLTAFYYDHGYINVKIGNPQVALSADKRYLYITVPIDEGEQYRLGKLDFRGDLLGPKQGYFDRLSVRSGEIFNRSRLGQDIQRLNDHFKDRGYAFVNVTPLTAMRTKERIVDLTFEIQKGSLVSFERINIRGNTKTRDKVIRREMKIAEGELYNQTRYELSKRRITALGFFEKVDMSTQRGSADDKIIVNLEVVEKPTGTFQLGAGFSSVENFIAQAQISQNNLFGRGQVLTLQAQLSSLRQLFALRFLEPYFLDSNWTFAFDIYNSTRTYESFARNSSGGDLTFGYPLGDYTRTFLTYKLENVDVSTRAAGFLFSGSSRLTIPRSAVIYNLQSSGITSSLRASLSYDTRDNRLFPSRGSFEDISVEVADRVLGSQNVFARYSAFARYYQPIWGPFLLKLNAEIGFVHSRLANGVPIFERYYLGGIYDIRGFRERSLSPRIKAPVAPDPNADLFEFPIGGNLQLILNAEIEFPIFEKVGIRGVVFLDAGNAFNTESRYCQMSAPIVTGKADPCVPFSPAMLRFSAGFGFRWFSPIGPLRFEWGIPLDRQPGEESIVFEFTIGNFF